MDQKELKRINSLLNRVLRVKEGSGNQYGAICTPDKNKLISLNGQEVFDYNSSSSCKKALNSLINMVLFVLLDNKLFHLMA